MTKNKPYPMPTQQEVKIIFAKYDALTGALFYVNGRRAGSVHKGSGFRVVYIRGKYLPEHKVIWCYNYGFYPEYPILHKDGNRQNNRLDNLYQAHISQGNKATSKRNRSGMSGISWFEKAQKWRVTLYMPEPLHIGYYADLQEAKQAKIEAHRRYQLKRTPLELEDWEIEARQQDADRIAGVGTLKEGASKAEGVTGASKAEGVKPNAGKAETVRSIAKPEPRQPDAVPSGWTKI